MSVKTVAGIIVAALVAGVVAGTMGVANASGPKLPAATPAACPTGDCSSEAAAGGTMQCPSTSGASQQTMPEECGGKTCDQCE